MYNTNGQLLYVAADDTGRHKIGISKEPHRRVSGLRSTLRRPVSLVHIEQPNGDAARIEQIAHWLLFDHHDVGEWFNVTAEQAVVAISEATKRAAAGEKPTVQLARARTSLLGAVLLRAVNAALKTGETKTDFIREAVSRELERRGKAPAHPYPTRLTFDA